MQNTGRAKQLKPYHGIAVFIFVILMMIFVAAPLQIKWGIYGVAVTEIMILLSGLVPPIILKTDLREMFPMKKPGFRQVMGTLVIWVASYLTVILATLVTGYFFPEGLTKVSSGLQGVLTSVPMSVSFLIIAVMPAVCEEILHRGFILSSFNILMNKWIIILWMGIIFGIFHLDPYRFLPTAILGMAMTYIMIETENILLPVLLHLVNNSLSTFVSFANAPQAAASPAALAIQLNAIAAYLIIGAVIPFILLLGVKLIGKKQRLENEDAVFVEKKRKRKKIWAAAFCSVIMAISGVVTMGFSIKAAPVFHTSITQGVNYDSKALQFPMEIEKSGSYTIDLELNTGRGLVEMKIIDADGAEAFETSCKRLTSTSALELKEGLYQIIVEFHIDDIEEYCKQKGIIYDEKARQELNMTGDLYEYLPFEMKIAVKKD